MSRPLIYGSGCTTLDNALGGGWAVGHLVNVFGMESAGKTLLMIEAAAQFAKAYPNAPMRLVDAEAAFDQDYAKSIGFPVKRVKIAEPGEIQTVEDWYEDLIKFVESVPEGKPALYMLDSLDALSSAAEMARGIRETGYKTEKVQALSQLFRRIIALLAGKNISLFVISQLRMNPASKPGMDPFTETGGTAFKFYAYQRVKIKRIEIIKKTRNNEEREVGIRVEANVKKNKLGPPFRKAKFPIMFFYGIDNLASNIEWLTEHKEKIKKEGKNGKTETEEVSFLLTRIPGADKYKTVAGFKESLTKLSLEEFKSMRDVIDEVVKKCDAEINDSFRPARSRDEGCSDIDETETSAADD